MGSTSQTDLVAWQRAMDMVVAVYEAAKRWPPDERFALTDQIRRAAVSVPSNIAEGQGRSGKGEFAQFLSIAHGSLREVETHLRIVQRLGYLQPDDLNRLLSICEDVGKPLRGLIQHLRRKDTP